MSGTSRRCCPTTASSRWCAARSAPSSASSSARSPCAPLDLTRAVGGHDARAVAALGGIVARLRPDLVHAHSSKAGAVARLARVLRPRVPVLYTPHGYAHAGYFERAAERRAYRLAERALTPLTSRVVCVCEAERRLAAGVGAGRRARVVHNGIAPFEPGPPVHPAVAALRERGLPVVAAVSLLRPGKGIETLIDAFAQVRTAHPGAQLVIAGEGEDGDALAARARARGVHDGVHFLGFTDTAQEVLAGADVFVSPSWAESFPYVVLEAMALGRPVAATAVGGVAEAVDDGRTGLLAPPRDAGALAQGIIRLISEPAEADRMGERGRQVVAARFTRERMASGLAVVYRELLRRATTV